MSYASNLILVWNVNFKNLWKLSTKLGKGLIHSIWICIGGNTQSRRVFIQLAGLYHNQLLIIFDSWFEKWYVFFSSLQFSPFVYIFFIHSWFQYCCIWLVCLHYSHICNFWWQFCSMLNSQWKNLIHNLSNCICFFSCLHFHHFIIAFIIHL